MRVSRVGKLANLTMDLAQDRERTTVQADTIPPELRHVLWDRGAVDRVLTVRVSQIQPFLNLLPWTAHWTSIPVLRVILHAPRDTQQLVRSVQEFESYHTTHSYHVLISLYTREFYGVLNSNVTQVRHGGFGLGFERLLMYISGVRNIRDVIAVPRYPGYIKYWAIYFI